MRQTIEELRRLQSQPLEKKILMTRQRIREWVTHYGEDKVYVSFSGGKDSTVLLDIARKDYPNMSAVFVDTGLEYPEIRDFVKTYDNVVWLKPKLNFRQVIEKYGYPIISKEICENVCDAKRYLFQLLDEIPDADLTEIENSEEFAELLNERMVNKSGGSNQRLAIMLGMLTRDKEHPIKPKDRNDNKSDYSMERYRFLLNAPFRVSNKCCNVMKKNPSHKYADETGCRPITGQMASESKLRERKWLQYGCNMFDIGYPISNPMSFWLENDVLEYCKRYNIKICSIYGEIVEDIEKEGSIDGQITMEDYGLMETNHYWKVTGSDRTGCMFCLYGIHVQKSPNRLELLRDSHPKLYDYIMRPEEQGGLGYKEKIDWINEHGHMDIKY